MRLASGKSWIACLVLAGALLAVLGLVRGEAFWSTSDGVYAMASRQFLHGTGLYDGMATSQPPLLYLVGGGLLGLSDSLTMLRAGLELFGLATALLIWRAVLDLTGRPAVAVLAGVAAPLLPVTLHENALLTPETIGAPLLLATALLAAREDRVAAAGALGAVACTAKLSFALPVVAILLVSPARVRAVAWFAGTGAGLAALGTLLWGGALWNAIVIAQSQSGNTAASDLPGLLAQEGWTALGLVALAGLALWRRPWPPLVRTTTAAAAGGLVLGLTVIKLGTYVNAVEVAEPPLLVLAAWAATQARGRALALAGAAGALLAVQSGSLLIGPADPRPYTRPFAESGPRRLLSSEAVAAYVRAARACPPNAPYPGIPYLAFVAHRRPLGDQPDVFILRSEQNRRFAERAAADLPAACPAGAPSIDAHGNVTR